MGWWRDGHVAKVVRTNLITLPAFLRRAAEESVAARLMQYAKGSYDQGCLFRQMVAVLRRKPYGLVLYRLRRALCLDNPYAQLF